MFNVGAVEREATGPTEPARERIYGNKGRFGFFVVTVGWCSAMETWPREVAHWGGSPRAGSGARGVDIGFVR